MQYKKGFLFKVNHSRSGVWVGMAYKDFNSEDDIYPLEFVPSGDDKYERGQRLFCNKKICVITLLLKFNKIYG